MFMNYNKLLKLIIRKLKEKKKEEGKQIFPFDHY